MGWVGSMYSDPPTCPPVTRQPEPNPIAKPSWGSLGSIACASAGCEGILYFSLLLIIICIYLDLISCWVWISIISRLVFYFCLGYIIKNCYMLFCILRFICGSYLTEWDLLFGLLFRFFVGFSSRVLLERSLVESAGLVLQQSWSACVIALFRWDWHSSTA